MLVVTRHKALVQYLKEEGIVGDNVEVIAHARPEDVAGRDVIGVLPHSLSCLTTSYTEVVMAVPAELRWKELTVEQVRELVREIRTYVVTVVANRKL